MTHHLIRWRIIASHQRQNCMIGSAHHNQEVNTLVRLIGLTLEWTTPKTFAVALREPLLRAATIDLVEKIGGMTLAEAECYPHGRTSMTEEKPKAASKRRVRAFLKNASIQEEENPSRRRQNLTENEEYQRVKSTFQASLQEEREKLARRTRLLNKIVRISEIAIFLLAGIGLLGVCVPLVRAWLGGGW